MDPNRLAQTTESNGLTPCCANWVEQMELNAVISYRLLIEKMPNKRTKQKSRKQVVDYRREGVSYVTNVVNGKIEFPATQIKNQKN